MSFGKILGTIACRRLDNYWTGSKTMMLNFAPTRNKSTAPGVRKSITCRRMHQDQRTGQRDTLNNSLIQTLQYSSRTSRESMENPQTRSIQASTGCKCSRKS